MENLKLHGAKNALSSMLFYYVYALKEEGYVDPKQIASEEVGKMISLADEQTQFVIEDSKSKGKLSESISLSIQLLSDMERNKQYDEESISIVKGVLLSITESVEKYGGNNDEAEDGNLSDR